MGEGVAASPPGGRIVIGTLCESERLKKMPPLPDGTSPPGQKKKSSPFGSRLTAGVVLTSAAQLAGANTIRPPAADQCGCHPFHAGGAGRPLKDALADGIKDGEARLATISITYQPTPKQSIFHASKANEILYGGAAGGWKTKALVMDALFRTMLHDAAADARQSQPISSTDFPPGRWLRPRKGDRSPA